MNEIFIFLIFIYLRRKMPFLFSFIYIKTHVGEKNKIELIEIYCIFVYMKANL
nr:MAG TPA: hypothetical protein [Caudoviricetes sp.]